MRKIIHMLAILGLISAVLPVAPIFAQTTASPGCISGGGTANPMFQTSGEFFADEVLIFTVTGPGTDFTVDVSGDAVASLGPTAIGNILQFIVPAAGTYNFVVTVNGGTTPNTLAQVTCSPADSGFDGTLCHFPPGNPDAAHTITVGSENAFDTHIGNHGDSPGACPPGVQSRFDDFGEGLSIFTLDESGEVTIWGLCDEFGCSLLATIDPLLLEATEGFSISFDDDPTDAYEVIVFYLHEHPFDEGVSVYQINIERDGELVNDDVLLFVDADGNIVAWATHNVWNEG